MKHYIMICLLLINAIGICDARLKDKRDGLLAKEACLQLGSKIKLTDKEELVNKCLMTYKYQELDYGFKNPQDFNFSYHYFSYKDDINKSKVYKFIKDMPKGAVLHVHDMAILGPDYLMNLTYKRDLYMCVDGQNLKFKFANETPKETCDYWQLVNEARINAKNLTGFNEAIRSFFTLVDCDPYNKYPSINHIWEAFMRYFSAVESLITYKPVWEQYFYDALKAFRNEGILYVEVRSVLPNLYEKDGTFHKPIVAAECYKEVLERFIEDYPDFIGAKLIYAPLRSTTNKGLARYLKQAREIRRKMPNFFAGFDLVGQEDKGAPLADLFEKLSKADDFDFFFHAGETNWYGSNADENLADAIILGAKRIGHGYSLARHPVLMDEVIKRDIAIEVNVISNSVLSLVGDVRNHPLSVFLAAGVPVVISSDDPGAWEADVISHDFYAAFLGASSRNSDLRLLKALALNSLKYSAMDDSEKSKAIKLFKKQWNKFIDDFDCDRYNPGFIGFMCRANTDKKEYCIPFAQVIHEKSINDKTGKDILLSLHRQQTLAVKVSSEGTTDRVNVNFTRMQ